MTDTLQYITLSETKALVKRVVNTAADVVTATMGPNGRLSVVTIGAGVPKVTKDGVTVAKGLKFNDPREELINRIITEPAIKTDEECGDGTTTTIMYMKEFFEIYNMWNSFQKHAYIDKLIKTLISELQNRTIHINSDDERLYKLALTSSNNDEVMSRLVTDLYRDSKGKFPSIDLIPGVESDDKIVRSSGLRLMLELSNPAYANGLTTVKLNKYIPIIIDDFVKGHESLNFKEFLNSYARKYVNREVTFLVIARAIENSIDGMLLAVNQELRIEEKKTGNPQPRFIGCRTNISGSLGSSIMQDIAVMFNAPLINTITQVDSVVLNESTDELSISGNKGVMIPSEKTKVRIQERVKEIEALLANYDARTRFTRRARMDEQRIRDLTGEVVTIWVGGETGSEVKERKDRYEDVVKAVKSALVNGILPGVGTSIIEAMRVVGGEVYRNLDEDAPVWKKEIVLAMIQASRKQYDYLMKDILDEDSEDLLVVNLATGETGKAEDLGIFDTAYASITALKGGGQTAKILSSLDSILISDKLNMVSFNQ